ncbi:DUF4178 domain-containing protein [Scopulibacillus cellulosilyticus]|uniref:DUF4178 domain-containing protein n=1 Tax=Scopulibacillus cellulosilyticus TaxID=2665665 RepID=A0ABW2PWA7_9BACL
MGFFSRLFKSDETPKVEKRTLMNLKVGDMVSYELADYQVVGKLTFNDHGYRWYEYQLEGRSGTIWVNVELDDELEVSVYKKVKKKLSEPIPDKIEMDGIIYYLDEKGTANVSGQGRSVNVSGMQVHYYDFCDENEEKYLSVEIWGGDIEVSTGACANDYDFEIIAGS